MHERDCIPPRSVSGPPRAFCLFRLVNLSFWHVVVFVYPLFNRVCSSGSQICDPQLSAGEKQELKNVVEKLRGNGDGLSPMRVPLQLSLLISPIYLLIPSQLVKKPFSRQTMYSISMKLGNAKTDLILEVERAIWLVIFCLADGTLDAGQLFHRLSETLPWNKIVAALSCDYERHWFKLGTWCI